MVLFLSSFGGLYGAASTDVLFRFVPRVTFSILCFIYKDNDVRLNYTLSMYLGKVTGTVVATTIYEGLSGYRLLIVESLDERHNLQGDPHVAVDDKFAGPGDTVFLVGSREAALACEPTFVPVDAAVVGFVDRVNREDDQ